MSVTGLMAAKAAVRVFAAVVPICSVLVNYLNPGVNVFYTDFAASLYGVNNNLSFGSWFTILLVEFIILLEASVATKIPDLLSTFCRYLLILLISLQAMWCATLQ